MRAKYVLSEVFVGLWRNVTMTVAMIITMAVSLTMLGASLLLYKQAGDMKDFYYEKVEVSIFLKKDHTPQELADLDTKIKSDPLVKSYFYESKQKAYDRFQEQFKDVPDLVKSIGPDSLPDSFRLSLKDPERFKEIQATYDGTPGIATIVDQKELLKKIFGIIGSIQNMALIVSLIQGIAALLLVANTIQVAAYSKRREVSVMKLVGASNWFIQAPFVLEAVFAAVLGSLIAFGALVAGKLFLMDGQLKDLNQIMTPLNWPTVWLMLPVLAGIGAVVSAITGWITLRFYIKK